MEQMDLLKECIRQQGIVLNDAILKVDAFLNHQIDPVLMSAIGQEFAARFDRNGVTKVLTIESSGIAVALPTALALHVPMVFARKQKPTGMDAEVYRADVYSFTKKEQREITVAKRFLQAGENVLLIDDFLANGEAALGLAKVVESAGCTVAGIGIVIEKSFQPGAEKLKKAGYRLESLARIVAFRDGQVVFAD